jgi:hypothetical protein
LKVRDIQILTQSRTVRQCIDSVQQQSTPIDTGSIEGAKERPLCIDLLLIETQFMLITLCYPIPSHNTHNTPSHQGNFKSDHVRPPSQLSLASQQYYTTTAVPTSTRNTAKSDQHTSTNKCDICSPPGENPSSPVRICRDLLNKVSHRCQHCYDKQKVLTLPLDLMGS